jgi:hypothetical protein
LPPLSSLHITPPLLGDVVCRQVGTVVNDHRSIQTQTGIEPPTNSPMQPYLTQVTTDCKEGDEPSARINGTDPSFWDLLDLGNLDDSHGRHGRGSGAPSLSLEETDPSPNPRKPALETIYRRPPGMHVCVCEAVWLLYDIPILSSF